MNHFLERNLAPSMYLPKAGDSGSGCQSLVVARPVAGDLVRRHGAWADQAHLPLQHVEQLRQFIETGPSQNPTNSGNARVVREFEFSALGLIRLHPPLNELSNVRFMRG